MMVSDRFLYHLISSMTRIPFYFVVHCALDIWTQDHIGGRFSQPQILDPELSVMYSPPTHNHPLVSDYSTGTPTSVYSPNPSGMTTPSEPSNFTSNNIHSPIDLNLSPLCLDAPTPTPPTSEPAVKKPSHSRKRPASHIPRPRNAFILFRSHYVAAQLIPGKVENDHRHISKIIGEIWNKLSPNERLIWEQKAELEKERHSRMYPGYRYKPAKLDGVVKRRVKCRGAPASSAHSSTPGIGKANGTREIIGSLNSDSRGELHFGNDRGPRLIDQEERRRDRCARVAELVQQGVVGKRLEEEAQRLGLDRESIASPTPQLQPSVHDPPGRRSQFHTNADILRALQEDSTQNLAGLFAPDNSSIPYRDDMLPFDSIITSSALSPAQSYTPLALPESEDNPAPPVIITAPSETDCTLRGWPRRRASSLPLATPSVASPEHNQHLRQVDPQSQQSETAPTSPMPMRSSSSTPLRRQHRLYYPDPRRDKAQKKQPNGDLDSDSDLSAFNHISYYSPVNSPPKQYLSPQVLPRLQLGGATHLSEATSPGSHSTNTSPMYSINTTHSGRPHEPIDLSAMYDEQDTATGHEVTLHSTYAINAGEAYSTIPATPAPLGDVPISQQLAPACKSVDDHATSPGLEAKAGSSPNYYGWHSPYSSEFSYPQDAEYDSSAEVATHEEIQHIYYPNNTRDSLY
ncbi:unnamed protein product [Rhizoctonia solani]|uniref:HMG box domain-containing protein n=1 Tax=Rhizoctonia solani TaxID=456999 RepID=A0A8H3HMU6_9AGAM|nr:unnamed protein product [Rhizoctonia solani]